MRIIRISEITPDDSPDPMFSGGAVNRYGLINSDTSDLIWVSLVCFAPRARTRMHTHSFPQMVFVTAGRGVLALPGEALAARPGNLVYFPPGVPHWHGAALDSTFIHLSAGIHGSSEMLDDGFVPSPSTTTGTTTVDASPRRYGMKILKVDPQLKENPGPLFTGPIARHDLLDAGETGLRVGYVRFPAGVKNIFHTHTAPQVLYITEGKGIVATEAEEHEVIPGTLIYIPPGERHWHGATDDSPMAHLTISTQGETRM